MSAQPNAYGFRWIILYSYLKNRNQFARIDSIYSSFLKLLSGVWQGSILGTLLFNIFLNVIFLFTRKVSIHNYADDNSLYASATNIDELIEIPSKETQKQTNRQKAID